MNRSTFNSHLQNASFREMFITEMGWNNYRGSADLPSITIDEVQYDFKTVAERNGFQILTCVISEIPSNSLCKKIDTKLRRSAQDYICIYIKTGTSHHQWVAPIKNIEKRDIVSIEYETSEKADFLFSKIESLSFDNTEVTTIVDVKARIQSTFAVNSEKITKDFYSGFKKEHKAFAEFISGIDDEIETGDNKNKQWYTSVMLNRLMFCYFVQKKGFLDGDPDYLRNKLEWTKKERGENRFFSSFYKGFLSFMFSDGLNAPIHSDNFRRVYGRIPYLNGGMFDKHQIELDYADIDISDEAFDRLFTFFDKWRWHLDTRITASGKDINPDVLGYIFEQYINDRAQMGAYYTKEDITEYIGRNCILPFLFDKTAKSQQAAFAPNGFVWDAIKHSGDVYVFDAVKKGYTSDWKQRIPAEVAIGLDTQSPNLLDRRSAWNTPTPEQWALPTEIWRETIERLKRCEAIIGKIATGEITSINDFITNNLDIRNFALDLLDRADYKFIKSFYHSLQDITILDPTCGSGAFLFAAMNILEPLYEKCIERMQFFAEQGTWKFKEELDEISNKYRSNIQYFIFKSIILRNLYGVDIMAEAVEIAKLRLFLKMVAVVDVDWRADNYGLDPLPDIDFNIRCGNTLVGYANQNELDDSLSHSSDLLEELANQEFKQQIEDKMLTVAMAFERFKEIQLSLSDDIVTFKEAKAQLSTRLKELTTLLDRRLFTADTSGQSHPDYDKWKESHQPFHWLAEFYQIVYLNGGFDVIIGNPPYVEYSKVRKEYQVKNVICIDSGNLYAFVIERSLDISHTGTRNGMIIQMSAFCTPRMRPFEEMWFSNAHFSALAFFDDRPGKLFENLEHIRVVIPLLEVGSPSNKVATTGYTKFYSHCRKNLFHTLTYFVSDISRKEFSVLKIRTPQEESIARKLWTNKNIIQTYESQLLNDNYVYYGYGYGYFGKILNHKSYFYGETINESTGDKYYYIQETKNRNVFVGLLNSSLFYWFYINYSDGHNFTKTVIGAMPFDYDASETQLIDKCVSDLMCDLELRKGRKNCVYKSTGRVEYDEYYPKLSKGFIDEIDKVLAAHYGFTQEELDFIINYDIKYRMGSELNTEEEE